MRSSRAWAGPIGVSILKYLALYHDCLDPNIKKIYGYTLTLHWKIENDKNYIFDLRILSVISKVYESKNEIPLSKLRKPNFVLFSNKYRFFLLCAWPLNMYKSV